MLTRNDERGASAILVAASLLLLIGSAALAVDLGAGFNSRRQDQTSADLAVLAGAIAYAGPTAEASARNSVLSYVEQNLDATYSAAEWETLWSTCTDPGKPAGFNSVTSPAGWAAATIDCISGSTEELRVRIPDQLLDTSFGGVLGVRQLRTSAVAHARIEVRSGGAVRPFGILNGLASGLTCLSTSPSGLGAPPCDGPDTGNFGTLNSQTWGPPWSDDTLTDCGLPGDPEMTTNIADGVDHIVGLAPPFAGAGGPYGAFPAGSTRLDSCDSSSGQALAADNSPRIGPVNTMRADTGFNQFQATMAGLINGVAADFPNSSPKPEPLLQQPGGLSYRWLHERKGGSIYDYEVDNTPLWDHLRDMADILIDDSTIHPHVEAACDKSLIEVGPNPSDLMSDCLWEYEAHSETVVLFNESLDAGPRFGYAPEFHFTTWGPGTHWQPIKAYRMMYFDTFWFNCNGQYNSTKNDQPCTGAQGLVFAPEGDDDESDLQVGAGASMKQLRLDQISAFLIPPNSVPQSVADAFPGNVRGPFNIRLTR